MHDEERTRARPAAGAFFGWRISARCRSGQVAGDGVVVDAEGSGDGPPRHADAVQVGHQPQPAPRAVSVMAGASLSILGGSGTGRIGVSGPAPDTVGGFPRKDHQTGLRPSAEGRRMVPRTVQ
jgi:hypothetical protein